VRISQIIAGEKGLSRTDVIAAVCLALDLTKEQLFRHMDREIAGDDLGAVQKVIAERAAGRPLAYMTGTREFFSETFSVNEAVLIPRPETEVLVEEALALIGDRRDLRVLDMGTGSGAIGIIIAKHTGNRVVCVDISGAALAVAHGNARSIGSKKGRALSAAIFSRIQRRDAFRYDPVEPSLRCRR
jgi:release factor glutamine methyltransferase